MSVLSKLFSLRRGGGALMDYDEAKRLAVDTNPKIRRRLAKRDDVQPEILYYLAEDKTPEVRREIAANRTTPVQADLILARDSDDEVRCVVAGKIARLAPDLTDEERGQVGALVVDILETLARDALPKVRRILSEELKDAANVPAGVIESLARDDVEDVAAPVLENSPLLSDEVLVEIIRSKPVRGVLGAIARRKDLGPDVSDAVVAADDQASIAALLGNPSAQIREEALDRLVDRAPGVDSWHAPLVSRPALSMQSILRLSGFVADSLLNVLANRRDIDRETADAVAVSVRQRLGDADGGQEDDPEGRAERLHQNKKLDEKAIMAGLAKGDRAFVTAALALKAELPRGAVQKAVSLESAKGITAIAWKAGLTMAHAEQLQLRLSRIAPGKVLRPKGGGGFPLSTDEMDWQLEFFVS